MYSSLSWGCTYEASCMTSVTTPQCKKSLDVFQIPSFKGLISDCYKLEGTGKMTVDLASPAHSSSSLFFPRFFFFFLKEASQSGGLSAQQIIIEHLCELASQFLFVRQNRVIQTHMAGPLHRDGHARVSAPLLNYIDFLQSHNLWHSLCRQTNFRKPLCFKKFTCVST